MLLAIYLKTYIGTVYLQSFFYPLLILFQTEAEDIGTDLFDPATSKLGGVAILTIHLGIMAQLKKFFLIDPRRKFFDIVNYPVAFLLVLPILPPWPVWEYASWANYVGGSLALAVLASVTAQKVRDAVPDEDKEAADKENIRLATVADMERDKSESTDQSEPTDIQHTNGRSELRYEPPTPNPNRHG